MSYTRISQLNIFAQACTILLISCLLLKIIDGEDWPVIVDPFPDHDETATEPPPPAPDCTLVCQEKIDDAMALITRLQNDLARTNTSLLNRVIKLEAGSGNSGSDPLLTQRVNDLEIHLPANVSNLMSKINTDINSLRSQLRADIASLKRDLETKINNIPKAVGGGGSDAKSTEVWKNLTQRINNLENGKIQHLINDNNLWRQNFRIVNTTFAKLKKSAFGSNVILTG